jgi:hypothetical protein
MSQLTKATRIKYIKESDTKHVSHKEFLGNDGVLLQVEINTATNKVAVMQVSGEVYSVVDSKSFVKFSEAKTKAKEMLKLYGVTFLDEVRRKKVKATEETPTPVASTPSPVVES